jgi:hypothetical protein
MISDRDSVLTVWIDNMVCSMSSDTRNQLSVFFLEEGAQLGQPLNLAVEVMNHSARIESAQHLVMIKLIDEDVQAINEVDCAGTLIRSDIIRCGGKNWW